MRIWPLVAMALAASVGVGHAAQLRLDRSRLERGKVVEKVSPHGRWLQYVPSRRLPATADILVVVHGTVDAGQPAVPLARTFINRWTGICEEKGAIAVAPAFDTQNFGGHEGPMGGYRALQGRVIGADDFVHEIVNSVRRRYRCDTRFMLYGHSAGGQFAARYVVRHPNRIKRAVISAPSFYAFPNGSVTWPDGMGRLQRTVRWPGETTDRAIDIRPSPRGWLHAAQLPITVIVGSADTDPSNPAPGHTGNTRLARARQWVPAMNAFAATAAKRGTVRLAIMRGGEHSSAQLTPMAKAYLFPTRRPSVRPRVLPRPAPRSTRKIVPKPEP